jgi:hypothetical protein
MIGRKAMVGLSLLCALLFSAIAVQSASATAGTKITAFACVSSGGETNRDFSDAHCDSWATPGTGTWEHKVLGQKTPTEVEASNVTTGGTKATAVMEASPAKVETKIECTTLSGTGAFENSEPSSKVHKITGTGALEYTGCTVVKPAKCTTKAINIKIGSTETQEGLTGPKGEAAAMGLELKAEAGKPFTTVTLEGAECALKGNPFPVEGSVLVTNGPGESESQNNKWSGATGVVTPAMSSLVAGGRLATLSGIVTFKMKGGDSSAITDTTVT